MAKVTINGKTYNVTTAVTDEEKEQGLQNKSELSENAGLLFIYDEPQEVGFWMVDTEIPLDVVFIDEYDEVISVSYGEPFSETPMVEDNVLYVLEVNANSGIQSGDDVEIDLSEDTPEMEVIGANGEVQMVIEGGERIFSRSDTKALVKLAKKADASQAEKDFKALGKRIFKYLTIQDNNKPEYVE